MALKLDILANTRQFVGEMKKAGASTEDISESLDELARDGDKAGEKLERSFRELAKEAEDAARVIRRELPDAYRDAGRAAKKFDDDATDNVRNFKDEAVSNFSEVASSFSGDVTQMADGIQGLTGGLASALTPGIGIPVAILGAAAAAFFASWQKAAEDSEARVSSMYQEFIESGRTFATEEFIGKAIQDIADDTGKWNDALKRAEQTGLDVSDVLRAMAGDQEAIAKVHAEYVKQRDKEVAAIKRSKDPLADQTNQIEIANAKLQTQTEWIRQIQRDTNTAAQKAQAYKDAMGGAATNADKVRDIVNQIKDRNITVGVKVNSAAFENWWRTTQNRAAQGIVVNARPGQGRFWQ